MRTERLNDFVQLWNENFCPITEQDRLDFGILIVQTKIAPELKAPVRNHCTDINYLNNVLTAIRCTIFLMTGSSWLDVSPDELERPRPL